MAKVRPKNEVVVGAFYQRSSNPMDVVYSTMGTDNHIHGHDARGKPFDATDQEVLKWTQLAVNDFPNSRDPRLAYVFDLHWDVKRVSQLRFIDAGDKKEIEALLTQEYGVGKPFANLKKLAEAVRLRNDIENEYVAKPSHAVNSGPSL